MTGAPLPWPLLPWQNGTATFRLPFADPERERLAGVVDDLWMRDDLSSDGRAALLRAARRIEKPLPAQAPATAFADNGDLQPPRASKARDAKFVERFHENRCAVAACVAAGIADPNHPIADVARWMIGRPEIRGAITDLDTRADAEIEAMWQRAEAAA